MFSTSPMTFPSFRISNSDTPAASSFVTLNVVGPALADMAFGSQPASVSVTSITCVSFVAPLSLDPDEDPHADRTINAASGATTFSAGRDTKCSCSVWSDRNAARATGWKDEMSGLPFGATPRTATWE